MYDNGFIVSQGILRAKTTNINRLQMFLASTVLREEACHMSVTKTCHCVGGARDGAANGDSHDTSTRLMNGGP